MCTFSTHFIKYASEVTCVDLGQLAIPHAFQQNYKFTYNYGYLSACLARVACYTRHVCTLSSVCEQVQCVRTACWTYGQMEERVTGGVGPRSCKCDRLCEGGGERG